MSNRWKTSGINRLCDPELLLDGLPGMAYQYRNARERPMQYVSGGVTALCGYKPEALTAGKPHWGSLMHPDDRESVWQSVQAAIRQATRFEVSYRIITRDNRYKWVWERGSSQASSEDGELIEGFITDITPLRENEEQIRRQNERINATVKYSPLGIGVIDDDLCFIAVNPALATMLGFDEIDIVGHPLADFCHPEDGVKAKQALLSILVGERSFTSLHSRCMHKNGHMIEVAVSVAAGYDSAGKPEFLVANIDDITERLTAEKKIKMQQDQLARLDRISMLGELMSGVAHEINQPLTAISTYAQSGLRFLEADRPDPDKVKKVFIKLSEQALRAGAIVKRIRQLSRQEINRSELRTADHLLRQAEVLGAADANIRGAKIRVELLDGNLQVWCDAVQIQQVILNLVRNAIDAMVGCDFKYGNEIVLRTTVADEGAMRIEVSDCGSGINAETAEALFRPFSTNGNTNVGLGLSISRSIVSAHGGQLDYHNNQGAGATFYLTLPCVTGDVENEA